MIAPKLLGTYESELSSILTPDYFRSFEIAIDIGCAEGYYAIGACLVAPDLRVVAYDISDDARFLCSEMATLNGVDDRVNIRGACTEMELECLRYKKALVISDCEGFEGELFSSKSLQYLQRSDLVIEVHEHLGAVLVDLLARLRPTHECRVVYSKSDLEKAISYKSDLLSGVALEERILLLAECRPRRMPWIHARAKQESVGRNVEGNSGLTILSVESTVL